MNQNALPAPRFDLAVIIPVEYHRDQAVDCVRGWAQQQQHPADRYQLILCAPSNLDPATETDIRALLRPWDRLEKSNANHDMALVAQAASMAESELLLFTESHCLPYPQAVGSIVGAAAEHPDWSGFSCTTTPMTRTLLSKIEANIYDTHIRQGLDSSGWMKVIDQCFVIRRDDYFAANGFRPEFGHFAEWLLAAELHRQNMTIGLYPHDLLQHYYSGVVSDLESFTFDFAKGHIQYLAECAAEPAARYFQEIPELQEYCRRSQADYRALALAKTKALPVTLIHMLRQSKNRLPRVTTGAVLLDWLESLLQGVSSASSRRWAMASAYRAKRRLQRSLNSQDEVRARFDFLDWFAKVAHQSRLQFLAETPALQGSFSRDPNFPAEQTVDWRSAERDDGQLEWLGLFDGELTPAAERLRWSKPTACLWLPLHAGPQRITLEWDATRPLPAFELLQVHFAGQRVLASALQLTATSLTLQVVATGKSWQRLDWSVTPFLAKRDRRLLGLPITRIQWGMAPEPALALAGRAA